MVKIAKWVGVAAVSLATLAPSLASACDRVFYGRPVGYGGAAVVGRVGFRPNVYRHERFGRFEYGRRGEFRRFR
jgi:hypothetical protein